MERKGGHIPPRISSEGLSPGLSLVLRSRDVMEPKFPLFEWSCAFQWSCYVSRCEMDPDKEGDVNLVIFLL